MKDTMRSVALIEPVGGHGGMSQYDLGLSQGLVNDGWHVSWYTCAETHPPSKPGISFFPVFQGIWGKADKRKRAIRYLTGSLSALMGTLRRRERVCHLHFFNGAPEELMLLLLCRFFRRRVVLTVHDVESFAGKRGSRSKAAARVYGLAHRLIVHNQTSRRELIAALGVPKQKVTIVPHGNYLDCMETPPSREAARQVLGIPASRKVVLFFGQIKEVKGLDVLLEAMSTVCKSEPEATLVIAGRPWKADFSQYEERIERLGLAERCILHIRYIPDADVAAFYAGADVVVLPYRRIYQSGVLLLAMSYGRTVVVSDLPGMLDVVVPGRNGYVFAEGSPASLAEVLLSVLGNAEERVRVAQRAFDCVQTLHDWGSIGRQLGAVYRELA